MKPDPSSDERAPVEGLRRGEPEALERVYRAHGAVVFGLAVRLTRDRDLAADVTQECFLRAWRSAASFRGASAMRTWLCRIALNLCYREMRRAKRLAPLAAVESRPSEGPGSDPAVDAERALLGARIERALARQPAEWQAAVLLREVLGMSYEEMSEAMGCPVGTVRSRLFRARAALRELLAPEGREGTPA